MSGSSGAEIDGSEEEVLGWVGMQVLLVTAAATAKCFLPVRQAHGCDLC